MSAEPKCPQCQSENVYADGNLWICPECSHEWSALEQSPTISPSSHGAGTAVSESTDSAIRDAHGNVLNDGDSVTVMKELKIKGSSSAVKAGTKVRNIRLILDSDDGHNIACKIDGLGAINLKSEFVKKA